MSRIYEALRRADLDRESQQDPSVIPGVSAEEPTFPAASPNLADLTFEDVVKRAWTPLVEGIPTLLDRGEVVEQFRGLRSHLTQARHEAALKTVLITSGMPSEGKSFVALNLAISLARGGKNRVLLIDGDLRRPTLHNWLGTPAQPGLSELLGGSAEVSDVLQQQVPGDPGASDKSELTKLTFLAAGAPSDHSSELITNGRLANLIASLSQHFDWILIDSPPILAVTDAADMAAVADGVVLVAREAQTPFKVIQRAQSALRKSRLLGVVLNAARGAELKKYHYSAYYSSYYAETAPGEDGKKKQKTRK